MEATTLVVGASTNPSRYSHIATNMLVEHQHNVVALGLREGMIGDIAITIDKSLIEKIDTVTLYIGPKHQGDYIDFLVELNPRRVIFNPGTENSAVEDLLQKQGISVVRACTLVMLRTGQY